MSQLSTEQELTYYNPDINAPPSGGAYMSVHDNEEEKAESLDDNDMTDKGDIDKTNNIEVIEQDLELQSERTFCISLLIAYIRPITLDIGHSLCCIFFLVYNFFFTLGIFIFAITTIATSLTLSVLFCIGLALLWLSFEVIILLSRFDLAMAYYLVERDVKTMTKRGQLLKVSVYTKGLPLCCDNNSCCKFGCLSIITQRAKHLFFSKNMLSILIYHILIRWIITIFASITVLFSGYLVGIISTPIWYAIDSSFLDDKNICPFGSKTHCPNWKQSGCECYLLTINNIWISIVFSLIALVLLPFAFILTNIAANIVKKSIYYFYTYYYSKDLAQIQDRKSLL